jgi:hypothetical protein
MRTPGIVVFSVLALVATSARGADATQELAAKRRPPSQAVVAKALAARVVAARTPAARYRALLGVMRALNLGVYTAKGKTALRGGRSAFHVYKFELKGLARVLPRDRTWTVAELARDLDAVGVRPGGKPLSGERLYAVLSGGVRAALRRPRRRFAVVPLLVRQLGLFRRASWSLPTPQRRPQGSGGGRRAFSPRPVAERLRWPRRREPVHAGNRSRRQARAALAST